MSKKIIGPRVLVLDIETSPLISYTWGLFDQNVALNQVKEDWHILSFAAKFLGEKKIHYKDQRDEKKIGNDKPLLEVLHKLLDSADIVLGQNSISFDVKKIKARMIINGMKPPNISKQIDTLRIAKKHFAMTSNKLEYLSDKLCTKKKSQHKKYPGFELWKACLAGEKAAWKELENYNKQDVITTEELYLKLRPYDDSLNINLYTEDLTLLCSCGNSKFKRDGFKYLRMGKYQRYQCVDCGAKRRGTENLFSKEKRASLKVRV